MSQKAKALRQKDKSSDERADIETETELRALANMLRRAQGLTLAFVQCNQPSERRSLVSQLRQLLGDYRIAEVEFTEPIENLLDELVPRLSEYNDARALFVYGLERSIRSDQDFSPVVANLNISRNLFPRHISYPIVLWLPAYAIAAVMRGAPDFFSWRSAVFQFPSPPEMLARVSQSALSGNYRAAINLTAEEKEERIAVIQDLLNEYESLPTDRRDRQAEGRLFDRLATLHYSLGDYRQAENCCQQSLKISQELEDRSGIASSLDHLSYIAQDRGDYDKAEEYCLQSLRTLQELGNRSSIASSLSNLGTIASLRRDYDQAEDYYGQSLSILQELGDISAIASSLNNLGDIARERGDYDKAEEYCLESLQIRREIGDRSGIASSLDHLSYIAQDRGDYDEAEEYCLQSLQIRQEIGDRSGIAYSLTRLGYIAQDRGDYDKAVEYYLQSLRTLQELGDKSGIASSLGQLAFLYVERRDIDMAVRLTAIARDTFTEIDSDLQEIAQEQLVQLQGQVDEGRFEVLVKEAQADPEKVIREALGAVGN
jgi:tetratricopeptide (TPR) repeat protein